MLNLKQKNMKYRILFLSLLSSGLGFSQAMATQEVAKSMSKGIQPGIAVFIPNVSEDNIEDAIKDVTKAYKGKNRSVKRSNEFFLDDASIKEISSNTVDIHQTIEKGDNGFTYTVFLI